MKYVILLGFSQEYIWITYYCGACAIDTTEENTDKLPEGFGLSVSNWIWLWFQVFFFLLWFLEEYVDEQCLFLCSDHWTQQYLQYVICGRGILLSIYCTGCCTVLFPRVWMGVKQPVGEYKTIIITVSLTHIWHDWFGHKLFICKHIFFLSLEVTAKDIEKGQRLDCWWQTLSVVIPSDVQGRSILQHAEVFPWYFACWPCKFHFLSEQVRVTARAVLCPSPCPG